MKALARVARAALGADVIAILALTFAWPALSPESREGAAYQWLAVAALWIFLAALAALVGIKACRAPRT